MPRSPHLDSTGHSDAKPDNEKSASTPRSEVRLLANVVALATRAGSRPAKLPPRPMAPLRPSKPQWRLSSRTESDPSSVETTMQSAPEPEITNFCRPDLADFRIRRSDRPTAPGGDPSPASGESEGLGPVPESSHSDSGTRSVHDEKTRTYSLEEISRLSEEADEDAAPVPTARDSSDIEGASDAHDDITLSYHRTSPPIEYCEPHTPPPAQDPERVSGFEDPFGQELLSPATTTVRAPPQESDVATERRRRHGRARRWALHAVWISMAIAGGAVGLATTPSGKAWLRDVKDYVSRMQPRNDHVVAPVSTPAAASVALSIAVTPDEAKVYLDGELIANPAELQRPKDTAAHQLRAEAPGYRTLTRTLRFERDLAIVLELGSLPTEAAPTPTRTTTAARSPVRPAPRRQARRRAPVAREVPPAATAAAPANPPPTVPEASDVSAEAAEEAVPAVVDELSD